MNGSREKIKDFGRRLSATIVTEEVGGTWAGSYNAAERAEIKAWNRRANDEID